MYYVLSVATKLGRKIAVYFHQGGLVETAPQVRGGGLGKYCNVMYPIRCRTL